MNNRSRNQMRIIRHRRLRRKVSGTTDRPRMSVFHSLRETYVQIIDDAMGVTLASASTLEKSLKDSLSSTRSIEAAQAVGKLAAEKALAKGIKTVIFDRGGHKYHGRVKALADAAREAGLEL